MKISTLFRPSLHAADLHWKRRLTWHHGSPFSVILRKIRMRCTTTSESTERDSCWSWVSDDNNFHYVSQSWNFFLLCNFPIWHLLLVSWPNPMSIHSRSSLFLNETTFFSFLSRRRRRLRQQFTGCIVYVGVKFVNKFATVALLCVIFSIIAVYTGVFMNFDGNDRLKWVDISIFTLHFYASLYSRGCKKHLNFSPLQNKYLIKASSGSVTNLFILQFQLHLVPYFNSMCVLGKRLLKDIQIDNCTKDIDGTLWQEYCILQNNTNDREFVRNPDMYRSKEKNWMCDSYFQGL